MMTPSRETITLDNCATEPIHIPGAIQPHGVLFSFDSSGTLVFCSQNAAAMLRCALPALGERVLPHHFQDFDGFHELLADIREAEDGDVIPHVLQCVSDAGAFDVIAHRSMGGILCEFERNNDAVAVSPTFQFSSHRATERLKRQKSVDSLLSTAVEEVRRMTGFDRVMAYRFRHDDSGDVVAESVDESLEPFLGRRYPASDIPAQARRLYIINTLRLIADIKATPVAVDGLSSDAAPLDMSHAVLRSVSPVHIEYLGNMGVSASMSVSIVIGGKLWGMLACHHMQPRRVAYTVRMACDILAQILASNLQGMLARDHAIRADAAASLRSRLVELVLHSDDVIRALSTETDALLRCFDSHGLVLAAGAKIEVYGGLSPAAGAAVVQWLNEREIKPGRMVYMDAITALPAPLPEQLDVWCGLLALPFGTETPSWLLLLRKEQVETVMWGGKPEKEYSVGPLGARLTPRGSFDLWREIVRGKAVPWDAVELDSAQKLLDEMVRADSAHMAEIARARGQLMAMLGHDLRDPIQSISNTATLMERRGNDGQLARRLHSSSSRMQRLVAQVMDMSMVQGGGLSFEMKAFDLTPVVEQLVAETVAAHPGVEIRVQIPPKLVVEGDADRIAQVLSNLLGNARHHGFPGDAVHVQLHQDEQQAVLRVRNSGNPIAPELAANLFEPFKRMGAKAVTNRSGLGLGLFIAHQVMLGHRGTLAYSYEHPHVIFDASFPLAQTSSPRAD